MRVISESKTLFGMMMDNHDLYSSVKIDDLSKHETKRKYLWEQIFTRELSPQRNAKSN